MSSGKGYSSNGGSGGTTDNTTEGRIPVKESGIFEDSALLETVDEIQADKPIRATIIVPTGSILFDDASILSTNTDSLEIEDCVRGDHHEILVSDYDDSGTKRAYFGKKSALQSFDIHLVSDEQNGDFEVTFPTLNDVYFKSFIVIPKEAGTGTFSLRDCDCSGCILNTATNIEFTVDQIDTEVPVVLKNRVKLYTGQSIFTAYSGAALAGHTYTADPTWGSGFVPYAKTMSWSFVDALIIDNTSSVTDLSDVSGVGSGSIITNAERTKLGSITGGRYLGVFADLTALETAYPTGQIGDSATVTSPNGNLFYWDNSLSDWEDSGTGFIGDMNVATYDPTSVAADVFSMGNMIETSTEKVLTSTERINIGNQSGSNTGDVTLSTGDPTQESLDLTNQVLTAVHATTTTDGVMSSEDKTKLDGIESGAEVNQADAEIKSQYENNANTNAFTDAEKTKVSNLSGTNTGDQDLSGLALKNNVLELDNTTIFTPDADYEPATKKYVDDSAVKIYYAESLSESYTSSSLINKVTLSLPSGFASGDYLIEVYYGWRMNANDEKFQSRVQLDSSDLGECSHYQEPQDGYNRHVAFRRFKRTLTAGAHTIELDYGDATGGTAYIWDASISVTKIEIQ